MRILAAYSLAACFFSAAIHSSAAQSPGPSKFVTLEGIVVDGAESPLADAQLSLKPYGLATRSARSGKDGRFSFDAVPVGTGSITVKRLGYKLRTMPVDVSASNNPSLEVSLEEVAEELDPVSVDATSGRMAEFTNHRENSSFGHFFDQADIQKIAPRFLSELFRGIPGAQVSVGSGVGNRVTLRGCRPRIWVNGVRTVNTEVDELAAPSEVDGIEIYPSMAGTPAQYMDRENRACGTVVMWTRR
jgi:carboxypeptidase family protein/TonB-dependent receptor-like protein